LRAHLVRLVEAARAQQRLAVLAGVLAGGAVEPQVEQLRPAIEEILRYANPLHYFRRTATRDTEIAGQPIGAGDKVVMWYESANRDERVFDDPGTFDVTRSPNEHVGFGGGGPHFCLGANLARREIRVMFEELFRWLPDIAMTGEPDYLQSGFIHGIKRMTCEFTPTEIPRLEPLGDTP